MLTDGGEHLHCGKFFAYRMRPCKAGPIIPHESSALEMLSIQGQTQVLVFPRFSVWESPGPRLSSGGHLPFQMDWDQGGPQHTQCHPRPFSLSLVSYQELSSTWEKHKAVSVKGYVLISHQKLCLVLKRHKVQGLHA